MFLLDLLERTLMSVVNWIVGITGLSTVVLIVLAFLAPGLFATVAEFLKPIAKKAGEGVSFVFGKVAHWIWSGLKDIFDSFMTIFTVACLMAIAFVYGGLQAKVFHVVPQKDCKDLASIRPDYKLIKRTPEEKRRYLDKLNADRAWMKKVWGN